MNIKTEIYEIVKNHKLRSNYVRNIVQQNRSIQTNNNQLVIPKIIIQYWHNPTEIPEDVQKCLDSWKKLKTKGFRIILFNDNLARSFIRKNFCSEHLIAFNQCKHPAMRCDYFRLCYIYNNGGIYIDADEVYNGKDIEMLLFNEKLKLQPLCYDVNTKSMIAFDTFVTQRNYSEKWIFYINNNPIIAPPNHSLILKALNKATQNIINSIYAYNDIQSITGPGNLTSSFVEFSMCNKNKGKEDDAISFIDWGKYSQCQWNLNYRKDIRNWRRWKTKTSQTQTKATIRKVL